MNNAIIRSVRTRTPTVFLSAPKQLGQKASGVGFRRITTMAGTPENQRSKDISQNQNSNEKTGLVRILLANLVLIIVDYCRSNTYGFVFVCT